MMVTFVMGACKKDKTEPEFQPLDLQGPYVGVWVETTLKKDTINFNVPRAMLDQLPWRPPSNAGVFVMGSETYKAGDGSNKSPGGIFAYYQKEDSIHIYNYYVNSNYSAYKFRVKPSENIITIGRFYERPNLPEELNFYRIR
jgi:hypothetical protein